MPCILPHVIFINCRILAESVLSEAGDWLPRVFKSRAVLAEKLRRGVFDKRCRVFSLGRGGDCDTEGYPIELKKSAGREVNAELVAKEPKRCRVLDIKDDGDASLGRSPAFDGLSLRLLSMVPSSSVFDTEAECSLRMCDLDLGERGSSLSLL